MSHKCTDGQKTRWAIKAVHVYRNDVVICRHAPANRGSNPVPREDITHLSEASLKRLAFVGANTPIDFQEMITLTYPREYPGDGATVKKHLHAFLQALRRKAAAAGNGLSYLWFLEFQERGAPHLHLLYAGVDLDNADGHAWVSERWYAIVDSGDERHLAAGTRTEQIRSESGARRYVVKYASKTRQKRVPVEFSAVGRFWGHSRDVKPDPLLSLPIDSARDHELADLLRGWQYAERYRDNLPAVLYGAAVPVAENIAAARAAAEEQA